MSNTNGTTRPELSEVWNVLSPLLADSWTPPEVVQIHPSRIEVSIQYPDNNRHAVDAAYAELGITVPPVFDTRHFWSAGDPGEFAAYGNYYDFGIKAPLLPGMDVRIYCHITTQADASAHWDGLILHPAMAGA